jgi:hypothetical protein
VLYRHRRRHHADLPLRLAGRDHGARRRAHRLRLHHDGPQYRRFLGPILLAEATKLSGGWGVAWPLFGSTTLAAMAVAGVLVLMLRTSRNAPATGA